MCESRDLIYYLATTLFIDNKLILSKRKTRRAKIQDKAETEMLREIGLSRSL